MDLAVNEKDVHGDFFNGKRAPQWAHNYTHQLTRIFVVPTVAFDDLYDEDEENTKK